MKVRQYSWSRKVPNKKKKKINLKEEFSHSRKRLFVLISHQLGTSS